MRIGLLRETGGIGDIICMGSPARCLKSDNPNVEVYAFVQENYKVITEHLSDIDKTISLGNNDIFNNGRRRRNSPLNREKYPYLQVLDQYQLDHVIDLFCPGIEYESNCREDVALGRSVLFAMAAGVKSGLYLPPVWVSNHKEREKGKKFFEEIERRPNKPILGIALTSDCRARGYPKRKWKELFQILTQWADVLFFTLFPLSQKIPYVHFCINLPLSILATLLPLLDLIITVDTMFVHLGPATGTKTLGVFGPTYGDAVTMGYPNVTVLNGTSRDCVSPCHYRRFFGWDPERCRPSGCKRLSSLSPKQISIIARNITERGNDSKET